jgi:uncharacterized protein
MTRNKDFKMALREDFTAQMKESMKSGDKSRLSVVRLIMAALKDKDIEARGLGKEALSDDDILALLQKMVKQRQDSVTLYKQGLREDLAAIETGEIAVISTFLPKQMDDESMGAAIASAVVEAGATSTKDMGKVITILRAKYAGQMDFGKASGMVKAALS